MAFYSIQSQSFGMDSVMKFLVIVALLPTTMAGIALKESTCMSTITFPTIETMIRVDAAFHIETDLTRYFDDLVVKAHQNRTDNTQVRSQLTGIQSIQFQVDVVDTMVIDKQATISAAVTLLYEAAEKEEPVEIARILTEAIAHQSHAMALARTFAFAPDSTQVAFTFQTLENGTVIIKLRNGNRYSGTEIGLIVVTSMLSFVLVLVSSVLLHVTGGWKICKAKISNCLFEEVDEEDDEEAPHIVAHKTTYPMQSSDEEDADDDQSGQSESRMTSIPPSSASGILGVARHRDYPAAGFLSPGRSDDESSMMYGDSTPVSRSNNLPLGITSMRKLPQPDFSDEPVAQGGFSGMIMQRLTRSANKKH